MRITNFSAMIPAGKLQQMKKALIAGSTGQEGSDLGELRCGKVTRSTV
jgi:hypothetical protein